MGFVNLLLEQSSYFSGKKKVRDARTFPIICSNALTIVGGVHKLKGSVGFLFPNNGNNFNLV